VTSANVHPYATQATRSTTADIQLATLLADRLLSYGNNMITVGVTESSAIGTVYPFTVARNVNPVISCLALGSIKPGQEC
jgi:hypothetical protein